MSCFVFQVPIEKKHILCISDVNWKQNVLSYISNGNWTENVFSCVSDGIDGKQARRTKSSSPLGELFDHGLDSWATLFLPVAIFCIFGRGEHGVNVFRVFLCIVGIMVCFVLSHWEKYNTGVLFLPWGYDIGQIVSPPTLYFILSVLCFCLKCHVVRFSINPIIWHAKNVFHCTFKQSWHK